MPAFFQRHKYHLVIFIELLLTALVSGYYTYREPPSEVGAAGFGTTVTLRIDQPQTQQTNVAAGATVFTLMETMRANGQLSFHDREFGGSLGKFIDEINGVKNTPKYFWIYYINNEKAKVGVSNYILQPDDVITWKYETHKNE